MRTPTQQTLDTCITHYSVATANPVSEQNGGHNHAYLTRDGHAHTAWLLHRVVFVKRDEAQFRLGFLMPAVIRQHFIKRLSAHQYP